MNTFLRTEAFDRWLSALKDKIGRAHIVHVDPGYRVYCTRRGEVLYLLLLGGDKSSQKRDIQRAIDMAHELGNE